ncbi:MAG: hypothetical protein AAF960_16975 [Bacteroidota bacterium]
MTNTIPTRIFSFLKQYPPFSLMLRTELMQLAEQVVVHYLQPNEMVLKQGEMPVLYVHIVRDGAITAP